jgi:hypothetical protein
MPHEMTPAAFAKQYREVVRVGFNWNRFILESWPVREVVITEQSDLRRCFMPWYIDADGKEVAYDDELAVPMCVRDVPHAMKLLNKERHHDIQQYVEEFQLHPDNIQFAAPTFALPDDQYFVLDRNHRLSALAVQPVHFKVVLWNVHGPFEKDALLDLHYWLHPHDKSEASASLS